MAGIDENLEDLIESLKQQRDELRVQMHLAKADAKQEWEELEKKFNRFLAEAEAESKPIREVVEDSAKGVGTAMEMAGDELKTGYERLRELLKG
jgi:hypothetical protein